MSETSGNEVSAPRHTHRVYSLDLKQQNVLETLQPGSSVAAVARQHGINVDQNEIVTVSKISVHEKLTWNFEPYPLSRISSSASMVSFVHVANRRQWYLKCFHTISMRFSSGLYGGR